MISSADLIRRSVVPWLVCSYAQRRISTSAWGVVSYCFGLLDGDTGFSFGAHGLVDRRGDRALHRCAVQAGLVEVWVAVLRVHLGGLLRVEAGILRDRDLQAGDFVAALVEAGAEVFLDFVHAGLHRLDLGGKERVLAHQAFVFGQLGQAVVLWVAAHLGVAFSCWVTGRR